MEKCERCGCEGRIARERFCKACKKAVIQEAREAGKIIENPRLCTEAKGRKCRSARLLGGMPTGLMHEGDDE